MPRILKQVIYGIGFLVILGFIAFGVYIWLQVVPSCHDKIQNQGEEGVDCGLICGNTCPEAIVPLEVKSAVLFKVAESQGSKDFDVLAEIYNPNARFGASQVEYEVKLFDVNNSLFLRKRSISYILPQQKKFIYEPLIRTPVEAKRTELRIVRVEWERLRGLGGAAKFEIRGQQYLTDGKPGVFSRVNGTVFNASDFDFDRVDVVIVALGNGLPIQANRTDLRTFVSRSERFFEADWLNQFSPIPDQIVVEVYTNVFESSNFIRRYGTQEKFQQLY